MNLRLPGRGRNGYRWELTDDVRLSVARDRHGRTLLMLWDEPRKIRFHARKRVICSD